jgi:hypothetical protein
MKMERAKQLERKRKGLKTTSGDRARRKPGMWRPPPSLGAWRAGEGLFAWIPKSDPIGYNEMEMNEEGAAEKLN